ncbi:hypothetical protein LNP05_23855 [Klebsiella pneumoniae subsp. pneumoniae]|nr:hypothetical protein [Klebsiella pneumoniae subsp. pneumoniae]
MNYAIAIGISREHGVYADREAARLMKKSRSSRENESHKEHCQATIQRRKGAEVSGDHLILQRDNQRRTDY